MPIAVWARSNTSSVTWNTPSPPALRLWYVVDVKNGRSTNRAMLRLGSTSGPIGAMLSAPSRFSVVTIPSRIIRAPCLYPRGSSVLAVVGPDPRCRGGRVPGCRATLLTSGSVRNPQSIA